MSFEVFNNLVQEMIPFVQSQCKNLIMLQLEIRKVLLFSFTNLPMVIVSHRVFDVFTYKDKMFNKYIDILYN